MQYCFCILHYSQSLCRSPINNLEIRSLIGLHPSVGTHLDAFAIVDLIKLVYRDYIPLKHGDRKRLSAELEEKTPALLGACKRPAIQHPDAGQDERNLLSSMLVQYLREVTW